MVGTPRVHFPDASRGPALQADFSKDSSCCFFNVNSILHTYNILIISLLSSSKIAVLFFTTKTQNEFKISLWFFSGPQIGPSRDVWSDLLCLEILFFIWVSSHHDILLGSLAFNV